MLDIPSAIKTLFGTDGVKKNFRVHFPNGEMGDITNDKILYESVKFTESVCSQDPFKFGLAESSVIEFETVGIANMYGMVIECGIEVDTSSLSAAQITAIQSNPGDGVLVLSSVSDIGYGFYRVPYGVFRVESCPRNHQAMTHRRVTAYSLGRESEYMENPFEMDKLATYLPGGNVYEPSAKSLFATALGWDDPQFLTGIGYTKTDVTPQSHSSGGGYTKVFKKSDNTQVTFLFAGDWGRVSKALDTTTVTDVKKAMFAVDTHGIDYSYYLWQIVDFLEFEEIDAATSGYETLYDAAFDLAKFGYAPCVIYNYFLNNTQYQMDSVPINTSNGSVYPFRPGLTLYANGVYANDGLYAQIQVPFDSFTVTSIINSVQHATRTYTIDTPATIYRLTDTSASTYLSSVPLQIFSSGSKKRTFNGKKFQCNAFEGNLDLLSFAKGYLELMAKFAKRDRDGGLTVIGLDNTNPVSVSPDETEELWWDEYVVDSIGTVLYGSPYEIGSGGSVYDMTDNGALKVLPGENLSLIRAVFISTFAPAVTNIGFVPIELNMEGFPWIEAGDAIQVTTEDGEVVDSFALRIEIEGVQYLRLYCESKGGEIIS